MALHSLTILHRHYRIAEQNEKVRTSIPNLDKIKQLTKESLANFGSLKPSGLELLRSNKMLISAIYDGLVLLKKNNENLEINKIRDLEDTFLEYQPYPLLSGTPKEARKLRLCIRFVLRNKIASNAEFDSCIMSQE